MLDGRVDNDFLTDGAGNSFIVGGRGNDTLILGGGNDVVAFNRGDGKDVIELGGGNLTLSLGREVRTRDLGLSRNGQDLVLKVDGCDSVTLKGWYTAHGNTTLQMVQEGSVKTFDFNGLVTAFDGATAKDRWTVEKALPALQASNSVNSAIGGDLAYRYGVSGDFDGLSSDAKFAILADPSFGIEAQTIHRPDERHRECYDDTFWNSGGGSNMWHPDNGFDLRSSNKEQVENRDSSDKGVGKVQQRIDTMLQRWFDEDKASNPIRLSNYEEVLNRGRNDQGLHKDNDGGRYVDQWQRMHDLLDTHLASSHGDYGMEPHHEEKVGASGLGLMGVADIGKTNGFKPNHSMGKEAFQTFKGLSEGFVRLG